MSYDLNRVKLEVKETCRKAGIECDIPIRLNGRLTRTLGRVHQEKKKWHMGSYKRRIFKAIT